MSSDIKQTLITQEGLEKLKQELAYLTGVKRNEISAKIKEAISYGDLSENAEYTSAKEEQAQVEGRISELEDQIKYAKIITESETSRGMVRLGSTIVIKNVTKDLPEEEMTVVGSVEADPFKQLISNECPLGAAVLGKKSGTVVDIDTPSGKLQYRIVKVL